MSTPSDPFGPPAEGSQPSGQSGAQSYGPPAQQWGGQPAYGGGPGYAASQKTNTLAIIALVSAFFCRPLGLILGFVSKNQIKKTGEGGNGLATAAIIVSILGLILGVALAAAGVFSATSTTS